MKMNLEKKLDLHRIWIESDGGKGERADLSGADLRGADLNEAELRRADLRGADLNEAELRRADLRGANLSGANLSRVYLSGANLGEADLSGANLRGAYLIGADLRDANLIGANLREANLKLANLIGADLHGADLSGANLRDAYLSETILAPLLDGKTVKIAERTYALFDPRGWPLSVSENGLTISAGCHSFSVEDALAHWGAETYPVQKRGQQYVKSIRQIRLDLEKFKID
jgi:uncharacterized protein YjbI with pentapeptide repeats